MVADTYVFGRPAPSPSHDYLLPEVLRILKSEAPAGDRRIFDLGCGNGSATAVMASFGFEVIGVDPSETGIRFAKESFPQIRFERASAGEGLRARFGRFPVVVSLEVVEHVYSPRRFALEVYDLVAPGGIAIISTPYHSYVKNLVLAVSGKMDAHFNALEEHGHIKFWSKKTLGRLLAEVGFRDLSFGRVGRIPIVAKSLVVLAHKGARVGARRPARLRH
jgi:2-polyprenyl-6-hydroxyphenyl methylase/3-demethylubiquinone-9 3-methyltransferase